MKRISMYYETHKDQEMIDLTRSLNEIIEKMDLRYGKIACFCPHTTAGLTINENADPDVVTDMLNQLNVIFPVEGDYKHYEGNSHAHLKASFMGADQVVHVEEGRLVLGQWQSVFLCEFDGPRRRQVHFFIEGHRGTD